MEIHYSFNVTPELVHSLGASPDIKRKRLTRVRECLGQEGLKTSSQSTDGSFKVIVEKPEPEDRFEARNLASKLIAKVIMGTE